MPAIQPAFLYVLLLAMPSAQADGMHVPAGLLQQVPAADVQILKSGDTEFPALYQQDRSGLNYGAVILLHGYGKHPDWESEIRPLRYQLPDFGWDTLSIALPESPPALASADNQQATDNSQSPDEDDPAGEQGDGTGATANATTEDDEAAPYAKQVTARMDAALEFLQGKGQKVFVLIGQNEGAVWALRGFTRRPAEQVAATVFLNAHNRAGGTPLTLPEMLGALGEAKEERPLLDLLLPQSDAPRHDAATQRAASVRRERLMYFRQQTLLSDSLNMQTGPIEGEDQVTRVVRGWLLRHRTLLPDNEE